MTDLPAHYERLPFGVTPRQIDDPEEEEDRDDDEWDDENETE